LATHHCYYLNNFLKTLPFLSIFVKNLNSKPNWAFKNKSKMQSINFIEELRWRDMLHDMTPGLEEQLSKESTSAYIGFDPTAASLHIGNLATIMLLKQFQLAGHKPYALIGGATGMIGDPSGKAAEREFLNEDTLKHNQECIKIQLQKFLDFNSVENAAVMVNNYDWFKDFSFLGFLREAGKFLSINYMIAKDSVQNRLQTGISFTEFSYQLLQGYDFYWLYKHKNVRLQMGGSDQWGNITTGTELIRRKEGGADEMTHRAFALTTPLVTKSDGAKFGKSEAGNVWLDPTMTTPFQFYQFWLNTADSDCPRLLKVFTLYTKAQIENFIAEHAVAPHLRIMQKALANEVTSRVHSQIELEKAILASEVLYGKATIDTLSNMTINYIESIFEGIPVSSISLDDFQNCPNMIDLLSTTTSMQIYLSKSEAKRAIQSNAVSINKNKITDQTTIQSIKPLLNKFILIGKGKKYHLIQLN
jgi:tyrosyl-tRNA synthetase